MKSSMALRTSSYSSSCWPLGGRPNAGRPLSARAIAVLTLMYSAASVTVCVLDDERPRRHVVRSRHASHTRNEGATLCIITTDTYWCRILKLQTLDRDDSDLITEYLAFAEIYRFILRAESATQPQRRRCSSAISPENYPTNC